MQGNWGDFDYHDLHMNTLFAFPDLLDNDIQTKSTSFDYKDENRGVVYGYHIPDTRKILNRFRSFTVEELRSEWSSYGLLLNDSKSFAYQRLIPTIEWLEQTGYLSYLPDRDGQLTFCKTEYLHELLEDSNLHF